MSKVKNQTHLCRY